MKIIIFILFSLFYTNSFCQSRQKQYDSLSVVTGVNVLGYSITYLKNRETFIIFYYNNGEMADKILYTKDIPYIKNSIKKAPMN